MVTDVVWDDRAVSMLHYLSDGRVKSQLRVKCRSFGRGSFAQEEHDLC